LSVKVVVASPGACACGCGDDERAVSASAGFSGCFAAYLVRFWTLDAEGLRTVYLEVMRVCSCGQVESRAPGVRRTVVGRAFSSNDDCSYHSALVLKYGMVECGDVYASLRPRSYGEWRGQLLAGLHAGNRRPDRFSGNFLSLLLPYRRL
jgi:hypothetical protein